MNKKKDKAWIFSFEYSGIIKVGGLGEVPANQAKYLSEKYDITVFIPSHGQIERLRKTISCETLPIFCEGQIEPSVMGLKQPNSSYKISFHECKINNVRVILLSGENSFTRTYLDDKVVYNPDTFKGKMCLFSIGMQRFINYLIEFQREILPDIIHMHDYHVVMPFIGIKQKLEQNGLNVASIITIHLLTWPRYELSYYKTCGIDDTPIKVMLSDGEKLLTISEIFALCGDFPSVEQIGVVVSDYVTTVSKSYLNSDIIPYLGQELIRFKSDYVWDGCDWDYEDISQKVLISHEIKIREFLSIPSETKVTRADMKEYLLTYKIGNLNVNPIIESRKVLEVLNQISDGNLFNDNGKIKAFEETGPLMISTGRISAMKGFDTIFEAIPDVIREIPNAKFLLLVLPSVYNLDQIKYYAEIVRKYPNNLRILFGRSPEIFHLAHVSSDVYCALSRWEPFGIVALEAMATKLPVITTKVGGLQESVVDIRSDPEKGTGLLIEKENASQFSNALITLFRLAEVSKLESPYDVKSLQIVNKIQDEIIKSRVLLDARYFNKIKENCFQRINNSFRWKIVTQKLIELYEKIKKN